MMQDRLLIRPTVHALGTALGLAILLALGIATSGFCLCYNRYPVYPETTAAVGDSIIMQGMSGCIYCDEDIGCIPLCAGRYDGYDFIRSYFYVGTYMWFPYAIRHTPCNVPYGIAIAVDSLAPPGVYALDCMFVWGCFNPPDCEVNPDINVRYIEDLVTIRVEGSVATQTDTWSSIKALFR